MSTTDSTSEALVAAVEGTRQRLVDLQTTLTTEQSEAERFETRRAAIAAAQALETAEQSLANYDNDVKASDLIWRRSMLGTAPARDKLVATIAEHHRRLAALYQAMEWGFHTPFAERREVEAAVVKIRQKLKRSESALTQFDAVELMTTNIEPTKE